MVYEGQEYANLCHQRIKYIRDFRNTTIVTLTTIINLCIVAF